MTRMQAVVVAASFIGLAAHAQTKEPARTQTPQPEQAPARRPRIGYAASPAPEQPRQAAPYGQPLYAAPIYYLDGYPVVAAPFVVLGDGSILANFGNGYERVLRPCASSNSVAPANVNGRDALGRILPPPGIAALQQGARGQVYGRVPERNVGACYRVDGQGRADVVRY